MTCLITLSDVKAVNSECCPNRMFYLTTHSTYFIYSYMSLDMKEKPAAATSWATVSD